MTAPSTSRRRSTTSTRARISGTRAPPSWPTRCAATAAWPATASISSPAPTSTATRSRRRRPRPASPRRPTPTRSRGPSARRGGAWASPTTTSSAPPSRGTRRWCRRSSSASRRGRDLLRRVRRLYCYGCERFYTEKEIVDGKCPDHQTALTFVKEKNYFFRMSKYQDWLIKHLEDEPGLHPARAVPERGARLPARAAPGSVDQPAELAARVGHPAALRRPVRDLRLVRRADQLRTPRSRTRATRRRAGSGRTSST